MTSEDKNIETPQQKIERLSKALGLDKIVQMQEEQAKKLDGFIHELGNTNQALTQLNNFIQSLVQPQQATTTTAQATSQPQQMPGMSEIMQDPGMKMQMMQGLAQTLTELLRAWRGNGQAPSQPSPFAQLGEQMVTDLIRATVDDVQQRVYNIRKLPPPGVLKSSEHGTE